MSKKGGTTSKFYRETRGLKASGGQQVKTGTILTREGYKWRAGRNVLGLAHLTAACDGEVYFTHKRSKWLKKETYVHVRPLSETAGDKPKARTASARSKKKTADKESE